MALREKYQDAVHHFYLQNYPSALSLVHEIQKRLSRETHGQVDAQELRIVYYRILAAQKEYARIVKEMEAESAHQTLSPNLKAIQWYSAFFVEKAANVDEYQGNFGILNWELVIALAGLQEMHTAFPRHPSSEATLVTYFYASILIHVGNQDEALRILSLYVNTSLDCAALLLQQYIGLNRFDHAQQILDSMKKMDEDAILTQLMEVYFYLSQPPSSTLSVPGISTATSSDTPLYICQELAEKYRIISAHLLTLQAVGHINAGRLPQALDNLDEALEKPESREESLAVYLTTTRLMNTSLEEGSGILKTVYSLHKEAMEYGKELQEMCPHHPFLVHNPHTLQ